DSRIKPGFITYSAATGIPDAEVRSYIREALSFAFGRQLAYLGNTTYDAKWVPVSVFARRGRLAGGTPSLKRPSLEPFPLSQDEKDHPFIDAERVANFVSRFISRVADLRLLHVLGLYWHAEIAALESAGAQFGATIESLRRNYFHSRASGKEN